MKKKKALLLKIAVGVCFIGLPVILQTEILLAITAAAGLCIGAVLFYPRILKLLLQFRITYFGQPICLGDKSASITRTALENMSASLIKLAESFSLTRDQPKTSLDEGDLNCLLEKVSEKLCKNCIGSKHCWGETCYHESYDAVCCILDAGRKQGTIEEGELPESFSSRCVYTKEYTEEVNRLLAQANQGIVIANSTAESREVVARQIYEVAHAVNGFATSLCRRDETMELQKMMIYTGLRKEHIRVRDVVLLHGNSTGRELRITARACKGHCVTTKTVAERMSNLLQISLVSSEENRRVFGEEYGEYVFCEQVRYHVLTGVAGETRSETEVSGDNFSFLHPSRKNLVMMISDGMGSGREAHSDSRMVIELLEQLLEAGFAEDAIVRLVNSCLLLKSEQVAFSTLDLCILNLYTGSCEFLKAGAATTFLKRKDWVETITSTSMPLGMMNAADVEAKHKKLYHGDYVIMLSDGALDCTGVPDKEEYVGKIISQMKEQNPQEIANYLLKEIQGSPEYRSLDDITILVTGIWRC